MNYIVMGLFLLFGAIINFNMFHTFATNTYRTIEKDVKTVDLGELSKSDPQYYFNEKLKEGYICVRNEDTGELRFVKP